ncbi:H-type lectin domain-containing protein [Anianabacter salinae]|uniref:H-type lectin domain-containing protein n=1 Tax=Anianabacter salinae TaxID=2851023 RepID=UPI00225E22DE|nr:H-type lectin domain-containing protein [Anianabacter salinae]MBV0912599.1 H-type lectin domain-containing protein [Anianabacter salinae]
MKRLRNHLIGVDQGARVLFSDFEDGGDMWTGRGPRHHRTRIAFSEPFREPPAVQISMSMFDMDQKTNQRAEILAENIAVDGFDAVFRTWGDTRVARVSATWLAIGELKHDDEWELY